MEIVGYLVSILMGLSLGMIGGGGSILTVPILVYLFSIDPLIATSTSLFIVGSAALIGGLTAAYRKEVAIKTTLLFAIPSFIGVFVTKKYLVPAIPPTIFQFSSFTLSKPILIMGIFASLMLIASISMIRKKETSLPTENPQQQKAREQIGSVFFQGLFVGAVTGLVGAGGGFLIVPALVGLVGLSMRLAIGTSLLIIAANSLFGFSVSLANGLDVNWSLLISVLTTALIGLVVGIYFSKKVSETTLKKGFGYFVLIIGTLILIDQIRKL